MNHSKDDVLPAAESLWQEIILALTNVDQRFFNGRHQPCPLCGGKDRARYIRKHEMQFHCNQCGDKSGIQFYMEYAGIGFGDAINDVGDYLNLIPVDRREAVKQEHRMITQFPDWYHYDFEIYNSIKKAAATANSPWQRVNGLSMLEVLSSGDQALIPLLNEKAEPCDFVMLDISGNMQTTGGNKSVPSGFYSTFGDMKGKRSYVAVSPLVAAHAAVFTQRIVHCCYDVANVWEVGKHFEEAPVVICANIEEVQEADSLKFEQLIFNSKNNTVNRRLWKPFEYMDEREKANGK